MPTSPVFTATQKIYVNKAGNDLVADGSEERAFLTIQAALDAITDASTAKRYEVNVGPGSYADPFQIKPWTSIVGVPAGSNGATPDGFMITEISAPANSCGFDASFASSGFSVGWYSNLGFTEAQTWTEPAASQPQLNFEACSFNGLPTFIGNGTSGTDNVTWLDCLSYDGVTVTGWQYLWCQRCTFLGGTIAVNSGPVGSVESTTFLAQNCAIGAGIDATDVYVKWAAPSPAGAMAKADLENSTINGTLTIDGANTAFSATTGGIPPTVQLLNGATAPTCSTVANSLGYAAAMPGNWAGSAPTTTAQAIDRIAAAFDAHFGPIP